MQPAKSRNAWWRHAAPLLVSLALVAWLVSRVSLSELVAAATRLNWPVLVPATVAMVLALYFWDAVCLRTLFATDTRTVGYRQALHVRGSSYLAGAVHYELGQALIAWNMARLQDTSLVAALSRSVLLAYHDLVVLFSLGLVGSLLSVEPRGMAVRGFCLGGLALLIGLGFVPAILPQSQRARLAQSRIGAWLGSWSIGRSVRLAGLRAVYYGILIVYAAVALQTCQVQVDPTVVLSTIPLVMLADGLPSISGLGTRDTALQWLLMPPHPEVLLALSLVWSSVLIIGRLLIGLGHLWMPRLWKSATVGL